MHLLKRKGSTNQSRSRVSAAVPLLAYFCFSNPSAGISPSSYAFFPDPGHSLSPAAIPPPCPEPRLTYFLLWPGQWHTDDP